MSQIHTQYHKTRIGELILASYKDQLCILDFRYRKMRPTIDKRITNALKSSFIEQDDRTLSKTKKQVDTYLKGKLKIFDLPLLLLGTEFQKSVWNALINVPYGKTSSYLDLAKAIGHPKAVRAVANANGANALALVIPCHRIIGTTGEMVGYGGGIPAKKRLLNLESETNFLESR